MRHLLLLPFTAAAGCGLLRDPTAVEPDSRALIVHSMLVAGADTVTVLVTTVDNYQGTTATVLVPLPGASVRISDGEQSVTLRATADDADRCIASGSYLPSPGVDLRAGCYTAVFPGGIRSGQTYDLSIETSEGHTVTGAATVPFAPRIIRPAAGIELPARSAFGDIFAPPPPAFEVEWADAPAGRWTDLAIAAVDEACEVVFLAGTQLIGAVSISVTGQTIETTRAQAGSCREGFRERVHANLVVATYDSAYTRYARSVFDRDTSPIRRASAGLDGALGVFAAVASASVEVVFVPE